MMKEEMEEDGRRRRLSSLSTSQDGVKSSKHDYVSFRSQARLDILPEEQHQSPVNSELISDSTNFINLLENMPIFRQVSDSSQVRLKQEGVEHYTSSEAEAKTRVRQYCNPPFVNMSSDEGNVSSRYKLVQVHVVIRHGDRSPMYEMGGIRKKLHMDCTLDVVDNMLNSSQKFFQSYKNDMRAIWQDAKPGSAALMYGLYPKEKTCMGAQLTGIGAAQHLSNGLILKHTYIEKHQLLKSNFNASEVHIKTTSFSRTYQSAVAFLYGFLPKFDFAKLKIFNGDYPNFCVSTKNKDRGYSCTCPAVSLLEQKSRKEAKRKRKNSKLHSDLLSELSALTGTPFEKLTWITSILDYLNGYTCHGLPLPCYKETGKCFTWSLIGKMWKYRDIYISKAETTNYSYKKYARLYIHPLLREIAMRMGRAVRAKDAVKFVLYSGHDLSITPLKAALGFNEGLHPPFASRIVFELYKYLPSNTAQSYLTRFLYNGKDVTQKVIFCAGRTNSDGLCAIEHFLQFIVYDNLKYFNANTYEEACNKNET